MGHSLLIIIIIIVLVMVCLGYFVGFSLVLRHWLRALSSGVPVSFAQIIGMRLRGNDPNLIIDAYIQLKHAEESVSPADVESVFIAHKTQATDVDTLVQLVRERKLAQVDNSPAAQSSLNSPINHTVICKFFSENTATQLIIRNETPADIDPITQVTIAAFENHPISQQTEQFVILALRQADALTISFVAELDGQVVGHIAFSPVTISDGTPNWFSLGPISVLPAYQNQGIGTALINAGLYALKLLNAAGCALVGDPHYYHRFGFINPPDLVYPDVPREVFFVLPFTNQIPTGTAIFHPAFNADH
ncbi:MAG: flotillin-like FloA family protein [Sedimentisphaerales bacterium]|nr:flotillin-like FloA family protein [Sedimentisphaerales bacterium]